MSELSYDLNAGRVFHMNGRIYDGALGRFVQADPIIQDPLRVQSLNRYSYTWNNPLNATDPSGFSAECTLGGQDAADNCKRENTKPVEPTKDTPKGNGSTSHRKVQELDKGGCLVSACYYGVLPDGIVANGTSKNSMSNAAGGSTITKGGSGSGGGTGSAGNQSGGSSEAAQETTGLSANFKNSVGQFTDKSPAELTAIREANPELVRQEELLWQDSAATNNRPIHEEALMVYRNNKDGNLLYDRSYKSSLNSKTGKYDRINLPKNGIIPAPAGYSLLIVEHTHPWTYTFTFSGLRQGPSGDDQTIARLNPQAFHIVQAQPPDAAKQFFYYGEKSRKQDSFGW